MVGGGWLKPKPQVPGCSLALGTAFDPSHRTYAESTACASAKPLQRRSEEAELVTLRDGFGHVLRSDLS